MKNITLFFLLFFAAVLQAQTDTTANEAPPPQVSPIVGQVNYAAYAIFDSTGAAVVRYQSDGKDTLQMAWGVDFVYCQQCIGERLFLRVIKLHGPGYNQTIQAVPAQNNNPGFDECWETDRGMLYLSLGENGVPIQVYLMQPNKFSIKWSQPVKK